MKDRPTRRHAACLMVVVTVLSSIPAAFAAKTPRVSGTLGKGDYGVVDDTPYYGGFGAGFLHINADGTYGGGEIRSGDLGLRFYGPTFGGPYRFQLHVGEQRAVHKTEHALARGAILFQYVCAGDVRGHQVGRELDALETQ